MTMECPTAINKTPKGLVILNIALAANADL
jgi:hypothetical protein